MTARKAAHSLQRAKGALASGFATVDLHHATGHDPSLAIETGKNRDLTNPVVPRCYGPHLKKGVSIV
jgi:hypothetical protein